MYSFNNSTAEVKRNEYRDGKSGIYSTNNFYRGFLKKSNPRNEVIPSELIGKSYHFTTEYNADIKESDVLSITQGRDCADYVVRAVYEIEVKKLRYKRLHLTLSEDV